MSQLALADHPNRYKLVNELHARPFPELSAPCNAVRIAIKQLENAAERDRGKDIAHLIALLDRYGAPHPPPGANHYSGQIGRGLLKWEMHTEFVTYTIFAPGVSEPPFSGRLFELLPADWLAAAQGVVVTSCIVRIEQAEPETWEARLENEVSRWFVPESIAVARVLDDDALTAADFRIDGQGHSRMAVLARPGIGARRLGRIVQGLLEIETYKSMSMLTLPIARMVATTTARLDKSLSDVVGRMAVESGSEAETLDQLLKIAAEIEYLSATSSFRFGAAEAYEAIVSQRIQVMREARISGRQLFSEFMLRRYEPAMRTCRSAKERLDELSSRAERAANLLRTRVDVATQAQNTALMRTMDRRAALQLRLQETVEGLSVVAISYYALNLAANLAYPLASRWSLDKGLVLAALTVPVVLLVWVGVRRIRAQVGTQE